MSIVVRSKFTGKMMGRINVITGEIIDAGLYIHKHLGPGLFESVYERILVNELRLRGLKVESQVPIKIEWRGEQFEESFRADLIVEDQVIVELKSVASLADVHKKQLLTYLRLADKEVGLLINFNESLFKNGIVRIIDN